MLTRELMAYVGLWILWGNTLLVAITTGRRALFWLARARAWRNGGAISGKAFAADESLGCRVVQQNGRLAAEKRRAILWHDRSSESRIQEGWVVVSAGRGEGPKGRADGDRTSTAGHVTVPANTQVWLESDELDAAARCTSPEAFERAYADARRVTGFTRTVVASVGSGRAVWLVGDIHQTAEVLRLAPDVRGDLILTTSDPVKLARRNAFMALFGFLPGMFLVAAICTALAMTEPVFDGWVSKLGGLVSVLYFLLVLPAGTMLRDAVRDPSAKSLGGRWVESRASAPSSGGDEPLPVP